MTSTSIERVFADICERHDLRSISAEYCPTAHIGFNWLSYAHWEGSCASGYGSSPGEALNAAIAQAAERRQAARRIPITEIEIEGISA